MKILFDHCVPRPFRRSLPGCHISTAREAGLDAVANGELLIAAEAQFDVLINWINTPASGGFPNNGNGGVPTCDALIDATDAACSVTLNTNITAEDLMLNSVNATVSRTSGTFTATGVWREPASPFGGASSLKPSRWLG